MTEFWECCGRTIAHPPPCWKHAVNHKPKEKKTMYWMLLAGAVGMFGLSIYMALRNWR